MSSAATRCSTRSGIRTASLDRTVDAHGNAARQLEERWRRRWSQSHPPRRQLRALAEDLPAALPVKRRSVVFIGLLVYALGVGLLMYRMSRDDPTSPRVGPRNRWSRRRTCWPARSSSTAPMPHRRRIAAPGLPQPLRAQLLRRASSISREDRRGAAGAGARRATASCCSTPSASAKANFSQWRAMRAAMVDEYRARTTPRIPGDELSSVMYLGAPVRRRRGSSAWSAWASRCRASTSSSRAASRKTMVWRATSVAAVLVLALILAAGWVRPLG